MSKIDYRRTHFCLEKWIEEIREMPKKERPKGWFWLVTTCENEILNGEYLYDTEYNEMILQHHSIGWRKDNHFMRKTKTL